jgi:peroxiredoxin
LLENEKAIIIGVPGAFTKVCSAQHLPGYINNFEEAKNKGITKILCVSVNDPNVMKAWGENQNVKNKIFMAADPYCEFTKALGAEIDRTEKGLGIRSARYTMLVEKKVIKKIRVEKDTAQCEISAAENFIKNI